MRTRFIVGIVFLVIQVFSVIYARFIPERFFCWGPYDNHSNFEVSVTINHKKLTLEDIEKRYRYKSHGWEQRTMHNIFSLISQYESTYGKDDNAEVYVIYSSNGKPEQTWTYKN